jgi:hypothetical protein
MSALDLPPELQERVACSISAAIKYEVPVNIMLAVAEKEDGRAGQWKRNHDGTDDVGAMQFNTTYLRELARYGISASDVGRAGCYPFDLAAWRLRMHIKRDGGDLWTRAANYHSRTPHYNAIYRLDLMRRAARWADWLEVRFATNSFVASHGIAATNLVSAGPLEMRPVSPSTAPALAASYVPRRLIFKGQP